MTIDGIISYFMSQPLVWLVAILAVFGIIVAALLLHSRKKHRQEQSQQTVVNINPQQQGEQKEEIGTLVNQEAQKRFLSVWWKLKQLFIGYFVASVLIIVSYMIASWSILILIPVLILLTYFYTKKVYVPHGVPVEVLGHTDRGTTQRRTYLIPDLQWENIMAEGVAYADETKYGLGYLAEGIEFLDPDKRVISRVKFAWKHYSERNFWIKDKIFHEIRPVTQNLQEQVMRYDSLMNIMVAQKSKGLTEQALRQIGHAKTDRVLAEADRKNLTADIERLKRENKKLQVGKGEEIEKVLEEARKEDEENIDV